MRSQTHVFKMEATPLAFSPGGDLLINASPDGVLKLWETSTNVLRTEYKPSSHLSATCSCLSWCRSAATSETPRKRRKKNKKGDVREAVSQLDLVAVGTVTGNILIYSVAKGDLHTQLTDGHTDRVNDIVWYQESNTLYSCSSDHYIVEWEITSSQQKHKWKGDKGPVHSLCRCSDNHLLSAGRSIKLWDLTTKQLLKVYTGHATEVFRMLHIPVEDSLDSSYFLSAALNDRHVNAWQVNSASPDKNALASLALTEEPVGMQVSTYTKEKPIVIVVITKCGKALLYEHTLNGKLKKPLKPKVTLQIATECGKGEVPRPIQILSAYICDEEEHKLLLVHGNQLKPSFEKVTYTTSEPEMCLIRTDPMKSFLTKKDNNVSKVRTTDVSKDLTVMAPGFMVPNLPTQDPGTRRKRKTSVGDMTMEERLNAISLEKPGSSGNQQQKQQQPRADTQATMLIQGLQSQDKTILNNVLQHRNLNLIRNTVKRLPVQMIIPLVQELTKRMHGYSQSGSTQILWLKTVLTVHTSYLITFPDIIDTLSSLYQMMDSRVNMFGRLSRLQGKLDIMLSQISNQTQEDEPLVTQQPLLQFDEESSDEDLEDLAIGHGQSDSEDNWEDLSDEESDMDVQENGTSNG